MTVLAIKLEDRTFIFHISRMTAVIWAGFGFKQSNWIIYVGEILDFNKSQQPKY